MSSAFKTLNLATPLFSTIFLIVFVNSVPLVLTFGYNYNPPLYSSLYETPQTYYVASASFPDSQGSIQTSGMNSTTGTWSTPQDPQNAPTFQKNVFLTYRPMPPPPFRRRRRLLPYFIFGFAAGSAAVLGGAAAAGAFRG